MRLGLSHDELLAGTLPAEADTGHILPAEVCHIPSRKLTNGACFPFVALTVGICKDHQPLERNFGDGQGRHKLVHELGLHVPGTDVRQLLVLLSQRLPHSLRYGPGVLCYHSAQASHPQKSH